MSAQGTWLLHAGDVNGDGLDDILIGTYGGGYDRHVWADKTYLVFGTRAGFAADVSLDDLDGLNGAVFQGVESGDASGTSEAPVGDVNGDGLDDFLIGARMASTSGKSQSEERSQAGGS